MTSRLTLLPGQLPELVKAVRAENIPDLLTHLVAAVVDVTGIDDLPEVTAALRALREQVQIPPSTRAALHAAGASYDDAAATHHRAGDITRQRTDFRRARAVDVVLLALSREPDRRIVVGDAVYEAVAAMGTTAAVVGILGDHVA